MKVHDDLLAEIFHVCIIQYLLSKRYTLYDKKKGMKSRQLFTECVRMIESTILVFGVGEESCE